jgi:hypothetical protein
VKLYYKRYFKDFKDRGMKVRIADVIKECGELLEKDKKHRPEIMAIGTETNLLKEGLLHPLRLMHYAKTSNAAKYMS